MTISIESLLQTVSQQLKAREWKIATAESCTGGGLAYHLTQLPGSSDWFERGFVTYSNSAKEELLGIDPVTLINCGAVSEETARAMAEGALRHSQAQMSVAITGIAGPTGGSVAKPVGMVWFAWTGIGIETGARVEQFSGDRWTVREQAIKTALALTNQILL